MITVEDLLMAFASAYDEWLAPDTERKDPKPEYAELIRQLVSFENAKLKEENAKLRKLSLDMFLYLQDGFIISDEMVNEFAEKLRELGVEP